MPPPQPAELQLEPWSPPAGRVQVYFQTKALAQTDDILDQGRWLAVLLIKPVKRSQRNPHGLIVMEYRQSQFAVTKPEEP